MVNDQISVAPAIIDEGVTDSLVVDDGNAEEIPHIDDGAAEALVIDIGNADAAGADGAPLGREGKRNLKAEAVSVERRMTHTQLNSHCPLCLRARMQRKPARRIDHDPATAQINLLTSSTPTISSRIATMPWASRMSAML